MATRNFMKPLLNEPQSVRLCIKWTLMWNILSAELVEAQQQRGVSLPTTWCNSVHAGGAP